MAGGGNAVPQAREEQSALSRRLAEFTEEALNENPRFMKAAVASGEFDFNAELKQKLQDRIACADFKSANAQALSVENLPAYAGKGTRDIAIAKPWAGEESHEDAVLRMLVDAHKPLRGDLARRPKTSSVGANIDLRPTPKVNRNPPLRLAYARDVSNEYALAKGLGLSDEERQQQSSVFRERFTLAGRPVASIQALTSLADQRIEEARARGQFKNLPRGKPLERDHNADSPFVNTTEYFLNRIIKKQEIVPPWIEKQQDLIRARDLFRTRLRVEWKRHAARVIASQGGSLEEQVARAERYAAVEKAIQAPAETARGSPEDAKAPPTLSSSEPFRDSNWLKTERSYHALAVENLNNLTRSYNLLAPELAKKPYFSLERELNACYLDVAPQLAQELINRSRKAKEVSSYGVGGSGGLWEKVAGSGVRVYDEQKPSYGFKEFWRDLFPRKAPA
ncbi:hypothetical protein L211DRAFT_786961 [Terfezia boudieri ATCC MYA-4762]|uniref:DnaJ homologue subfamily C member 28 conserved domain-containing protein n=1 Tax=Terfezia boudieri ATCC MYA-4762 TaxID=1051890 RepID=A0A3N4LK97_9PEZI|nr:hypothetical protein L211DRAFT_786961 [Terfezia boudieri ATCC MYA-4762]